MGNNLSKKLADIKLKSNIHNVETLKNRLKVLSSQADYNKFREKYETEKIERHNKIQEEAHLEKQEIEEKLKYRFDNSEKKVKHEKLKV